MEGLPTKKWKTIQEAHYINIDSKHNAKRWILALLKLLVNTAWDQWEHRNEILHRIDQPRQQRAIKLLNEEILTQLSLGYQTLPARDRRYFSFSYTSLISKPFEYKKAWISNVYAARQAAVLRSEEDALRAAQADDQRNNFFLPRVRRLVPPQLPNIAPPPANNAPQQNAPQQNAHQNTDNTNNPRAGPRAGARRNRRNRRNNPAPDIGDTTLIHWMRTGRLR